MDLSFLAMSLVALGGLGLGAWAIAVSLRHARQITDLALQDHRARQDMFTRRAAKQAASTPANAELAPVRPVTARPKFEEENLAEVVGYAGNRHGGRA